LRVIHILRGELEMKQPVDKPALVVPTGVPTLATPVVLPCAT
jgi:hypothetical protein